MARKDNHDLTRKFESLVDELTPGMFGGDEAAAIAWAGEAIVAQAMSRLGGGPVRSEGPADVCGRDLSAILDDRKDLVAAVCQVLDLSCARIRETTVRDAGAVYTPPSLARFICRRTVESHLLYSSRARGDRSYASIEELLEAGSDDERGKAYDKLKNIKLLDSSCGTGIFLEAALDELLRLKLALGKRLFQGPADEGRTMAETIAGNLYGMDIEPYSVKATGMRLMLRLMASCQGSDLDVRDVKMNLATGNALLPAANGFLQGGFDVIVGNPPYMRVKSMFKDARGAERKKMKADLSRQLLSSGLYHYQEGNLNLYKLFIERNLSLLKDGGTMGLIFPSSFLTETTSTKLRELVFSRHAVEEIVEAPERSRLFGDVSQATSILICHRGKPGGSFRLRIGAGQESLNGGASVTIDLCELEALTRGRMEVPLLRVPDLEWTMLRSLSRIPPFSGNEHFPPVGEVSVGSVDETIDKEFISHSPTGDIFVKGIHLKEYSVDLSPEGCQPRWVKKEEFLNKRPAAAKAIASPRIIGRNTLNKACSRRLKFAPLPAGYLCGNSIKQITVTDSHIDPLYLMGLLNSSVLNWHFEVFCSQNNIRNYSVEALPIPRAPSPVQQAFAFVARLIMRSAGEDREFLDRRLMDAMAYELYFMDMRMLSSAVLASIDEEATASSLNRQDDIRDVVDAIARREGFRVVQRATYRHG